MGSDHRIDKVSTNRPVASIMQLEGCPGDGYDLAKALILEPDNRAGSFATHGDGFVFRYLDLLRLDLPGGRPRHRKSRSTASEYPRLPRTRAGSSWCAPLHRTSRYAADQTVRSRSRTAHNPFPAPSFHTVSSKRALLQKARPWTSSPHRAKLTCRILRKPRQPVAGTSASPLLPLHA